MTRNDSTRLHIIVLVLLFTPFYLNDFANIFVDDWRLWLFIDYTGVKLFPLLLIAWLIRSGRMAPQDFGLVRQGVWPFLTVYVVVTVVGTVIDQNGYAAIATLPGYAGLGGMPPIADPAWDWLDLTLGLLLVGIVEELVFRGYALTFLRRFTGNRLLIVLISSVAFGLIHWSLGLHAVLITSLIGAVFMVAYLATRALPPIMLAHFTINFIDFAGVIPKTFFKFT